jgi:hypothetical protein
MAEELTEEAKAKLLALDKEARIVELFEGYGSDERQRLLASKSFGDRFEWNGARLTFKLDDEKVVATDPRVREHFQKQWEFLLPPYKAADDGNNGGGAEVDPLLVEAALRTVNVTQRGKLVTALGGDIAKANELARSYGLRDIHDRRAGIKPANVSNEKPGGDKTSKGNGKSTNPWREESWDVAAQGRVIAQLGVKKATEIAKAAGRSVTGVKLPASEYAA